MTDVRVVVAVFAAIFFSSGALAANAVISASPTSGRAPVSIDFDGSSSTGATSYLWDFGDGGAAQGATASHVSHIYTVAGIYTARLTVTDGEGQTSTAEIPVEISGSGEGPETPGMNFRMATINSRFVLKHTGDNNDSFNLVAAFNSVDLPGTLNGLAVQFAVGSFKIEGTLNQQGILENPERKKKPAFFLQIDRRTQQLIVSIKRANLGAALAEFGALNAEADNLIVTVKYALTVGAETYIVNTGYSYKSKPGATGTGTFALDNNVSGKRGAIKDGFFVITHATALENIEGNAHFFEFNCLLSAPNGVPISASASGGRTPSPPIAGNWTITLNNADPITIPLAHLRSSDENKRNADRGEIIFTDSDRARGRINQLIVSVPERRLTIRTWDIEANENVGGSGLPLRGRAFTAYNFALRIDLDLFDGTKLQGTTSVRLARRSRDDAFWEIGRSQRGNRF